MHIEWVKYGISEHATLDEFHAAHPGAVLRSIDDRDFIAFCAECGTLIDQLLRRAWT